MGINELRESREILDFSNNILKMLEGIEATGTLGRNGLSKIKRSC